jgi:NADPH:quinone reductase-like Zn-dependent oxidoreductase
VEHRAGFAGRRARRVLGRRADRGGHERPPPGCGQPRHRQRLETLGRLADAGRLRPQVEAVLPLDQAREALARVAGRHTRGKIVLQIGR